MIFIYSYMVLTFIIIIYLFMTKNTKKKINNCQRHQFSLKPKGDYALQPQFYQVSFCQHQQQKEKKQPTETNSPCLNCPIFNKDNNFATPTFILNTEQGTNEAQGQRLRQQHVRRMLTYTEQKSQINVPKPRSKNHYCNVCRQNYGDYLEHIQSPVHKKKIKSSDFNKYILELTKKFNRTKVEEEPRIQYKNSAILSTVLQQSPDGDNDSVQIISNPYKKVKLNTQEPVNTYPARVQPQCSNYYNQTYQSTLYPFNQMPGFNTTALSSRLFPHYNASQNNYNFNINMNLFLNNMPNYLNTPFNNPYINLEYQNLLMNQLNNQVAGFSCNFNSFYGNNYLPAGNMGFECPIGNKGKPKQVSYIIIDE